MLVMRYVLVGYSHLSAPDAGTDIAHAVVVTDSLMLIVRIALAGLSSIPEDFAGLFGIGADQRTASRSGYHLVAVEREHAEKVVY